MRILALDYGSKRIGVALSDELGLTAQPLTTIHRTNRAKDLAVIAGYVSEYAVESIVIGYPRRLDGTEGIQCEKVKGFMALLADVVYVPIIPWDETLTSWEAESLLSEANVKARKRKGIIDKIAAALILQSYLDRKRIKASADEDGD